jgi:hypothetical protein
MKSALMLLPLLAGLSMAAEDPALTLDRIEGSVTRRIQTGVLDPILGQGRSSAFVKLTLLVKRDDDRTERAGEGRMTRTRTRKDLHGDADFDKGSASDAASATRPDSTSEQSVGDDQRSQESHQTKGKTDDAATITSEYKDLRIVILHDDKAPPKKLEQVRAALLAIYGPDLKADDVRFQAASFEEAQP